MLKTLEYAHIFDEHSVWNAILSKVNLNIYRKLYNDYWVSEIFEVTTKHYNL